VPVSKFLHSTLGWIPLFGDTGGRYGRSLFLASVVLAIMILPIIAALSREIFLQVPHGNREAAYALGATRWEMIRMAVLPYGRVGVIGAIMLGLGRALGETMAVTMVIGNNPQVSTSLFAPQYTMAAVIANEFAEAADQLHLHALVEIGLVLFVITLIVNVISRAFIWSLGRQARPARVRKAPVPAAEAA